MHCYFAILCKVVSQNLHFLIQSGRAGKTFLQNSFVEPSRQSESWTLNYSSGGRSTTIQRPNADVNLLRYLRWRATSHALVPSQLVPPGNQTPSPTDVRCAGVSDGTGRRAGWSAEATALAARRMSAEYRKSHTMTCVRLRRFKFTKLVGLPMKVKYPILQCPYCCSVYSSRRRIWQQDEVFSKTD